MTIADQSGNGIELAGKDLQNTLHIHFTVRASIAKSPTSVDLKRNWSRPLEKPQLLDRLHASVGVNGRYLALPIEHWSLTGSRPGSSDRPPRSPTTWNGCAMRPGPMS